MFTRGCLRESSLSQNNDLNPTTEHLLRNVCNAHGIFVSVQKQASLSPETAHYMAEQDPGRGPPSKRRKLDLDFASEAGCTPPPTDTQAAETLAGLNRPISPPASRRKRSRTPTPATPRVEADAHVTKQSALTPPRAAQTNTGEEKEAQTRYVPSPIQLTRIRDLAPHQNVDTVGLKEILGDPMIKECWNFNFLFDLDFVM